MTKVKAFKTIATAQEGDKVTLDGKFYLVVKVEGSLATIARCDEAGKKLAGRPAKVTMVEIPF